MLGCWGQWIRVLRSYVVVIEFYDDGLGSRWLTFDRGYMIKCERKTVNGESIPHQNAMPCVAVRLWSAALCNALQAQACASPPNDGRFHGRVEDGLEGQ